MLGAFIEGQSQIDQNRGPNEYHGTSGSRFNDLDSRVAVSAGLNLSGGDLARAVADAIKKKTFTLADLKSVAFAMDYQVVEGKDTLALIAKLDEAKEQLAQATNRAVQAETALAAHLGNPRKGR